MPASSPAATVPVGTSEPSPAADKPLTPEVERLLEAVEAFDPADRSSIDAALRASEAVRQNPDPRAVTPLIELAMARVPRLSPGQAARIAAVRALGRYGEHQAAVSALIRILEADSKASPVRLKAAAVNALAETGSPEAVQPLLMAMYSVSPIFMQVRGALTRLGKQAKPELLEIFTGKHAALEKFARIEGFSVDCDKAAGPLTQCKAPGNLQFKAAILLGDLRAKEALPAMHAELAKPGKVSFFDPRTGAPGPLNHNAILDALRKIGDLSSAAAVLAYSRAKSTDDTVRPLAIDVYSMLTRDTAQLPALAKMIRDDTLDDPIRLAAALAYGRLVRDKSQLRVLDSMVAKFERWAKKSDRKARTARSKEDREYNEGTASGYRAFVQTFNEHKIRAQVGIVCRDDAKCYASLLTMSPDDIVGKLGSGHRALETWVKKNYRVAALDRALIELAKLGAKARIAQADLLEHADSTERIVREGVLLALTSVAKLPCDECVTRLAEVIESQSDQTTLDWLTRDTQSVLHYFQWAGR